MQLLTSSRVCAHVSNATCPSGRPGGATEKPMLYVTLCLPARSCAAWATMTNASSALLTSTSFASVVKRIRLSAVGRDS